ncbi:cytochrome c oxidase assembly protein [Bosea lathyri]|uniref:cytochrome c oxidase assembly protein n=1 Tax=Bosea lathyri TaxID=1036778 RepID=UPI0013575EF2
MGVVTVALVEIGPLSLQMLQHLALMNLLAPLAALLFAGRFRPGAPHMIWKAGLLQILLLWAWHAPAVQQATAGSAIFQLALLILLAVSAVAFWRAVIAVGASSGWRSLAALMLTGKFACLLGVLLISAPRDLYGLPGLALALCTTGPSTLADQQLAGLLMITACPLSYLVAGVILAAQMLARLDLGQGPEMSASEMSALEVDSLEVDADVAARSR